jgi:hypothetical protein
MAYAGAMAEMAAAIIPHNRGQLKAADESGESLAATPARKLAIALR